MTNTLTIQIENPAIMSSIRKVLNALDGVRILPQRKSVAKKRGIDEALEDVRLGRVSDTFSTPEEVFEHLGI
ncbi:MAG: hypothetical protein IKP36_00610 [Bacteroidaceae bacterium]|nr:hypothetical protein [Bacteroidaceae bacterium]MBR6142257.1 hypothetical protein [Bacteroidaceae bacterium]